MSTGIPDAPDLDEATIAIVIDRFYERIRADPTLGPVFNGAVVDWDSHLQKLAAFWSSVMLTSGRYKGNPVAVHRRHTDVITPAMFDRWLALWTDITSTMLPAETARAMQGKAAMIGESLKLAMYFRLPPATSAGGVRPSAAVPL